MPFFSPLAFLLVGQNGSFNLIFFRASCILSFCVPIKRCSVLQHGGLSHLCNTVIPSGIFPFFISHASLCVLTLLPFTAITPYLSPAPCHSKQPLLFCFSLDSSLCCMLFMLNLFYVHIPQLARHQRYNDSPSCLGIAPEPCALRRSCRLLSCTPLLSARLAA